MYIYIVSVFALGMLDALPLSFHVFSRRMLDASFPCFNCVLYIYTFTYAYYFLYKYTHIYTDTFTYTY